MKLSQLFPALFAAASILLAGEALADDYPSGYSLVPPVAIGGVEGGSSPADDGHNITLPAKGAEAIRAACLKQGQLWIFGDPQPHTCTKVTGAAEVLLLWLTPAVKPPRQGVMSPPVLLAATAFPPQHYRERRLSTEEMATLRATLEKNGSGKSAQPSANISAVEIPGGDTVFYLVPGRHLLDTNEEETCATTATLLYVKNPQGLSYAGELQAHPAAFVQRTANALLDALVVKDCGKKMSLWQVAPQVRQLIDYSNGYEYGG